MRPKTLIILALVVVSAGLLLLRQRGGQSNNQPLSAAQSDTPSALDETTASVPQSTQTASSSTQAPSLPTNSPMVASVNATQALADSPAARQKAYVEQRISELEALARQDDPASLDSILSELANRDPEIRKAALEATIQFGSRDAIPRLMDAAAQTDDSHERATIEDAIEFLKLPSLSEVIGSRTVQPAKPAGMAKPAPKH